MIVSRYVIYLASVVESLFTHEKRGEGVISDPTVRKTSFRKKPPKIISYRNYEKFSPINFRNELKLYLSGIDIYNISNDDFVFLFMDILDLHAPLKQKYIRANDSP